MKLDKDTVIEVRYEKTFKAWEAKVIKGYKPTYCGISKSPKKALKSLLQGLKS